MHGIGDIGKMKCALGLMSGTSVDGIDVALIRTDGEKQVERGPAMSFGFSAEQRAMIVEAVSDGARCRTGEDRPGNLAEVERHITEINAAAVSAFLRKQGIERSCLDVVGFHGQTVLHRPDVGLTVQLGDGQLLADLVRVPVVYDLRSADVAAGGEGAPLVPVYHRALVAGLPERPIAVLNIGGVANVTWIGSDDELIAFDTGPGNALIDDWVREHTGQDFDDRGRLARSGRCGTEALASLLDDDYFKRPPPKSLDRNHFSADAVQHLSPADGAATLAQFTIEAVEACQQWLPEAAKTWIVCGGGRHNNFLMEALSSRLTGDVRAADEFGLDGDSVEAEAWAYLAIRSKLGLPITFPGTTGVGKPQTGGVFVPFEERSAT